MVQPYFSIVIVNFRSIWGVSSLIQTLFSLEKNTDLFEVIVVNNDKSESRALAHLATVFPLRIIEKEKNVGFGQGANEALFCARGEVIGFLNPDLEWQSSFLHELADFYKKQAMDVIVGIPLMDKNGDSERFSTGSAPTLFWLMIYNLHLGSFLKAPQIDWVSGGSLFVPRKLFTQLFGFSRDFFLYFEDVDFCVRAKFLGASVRLSPVGSFVHGGGKSFVSVSQQKKRYYAAQSIYFKKYRPKHESLFVNLFHFVFHGV